MAVRTRYYTEGNTARKYTEAELEIRREEEKLLLDEKPQIHKAVHPQNALAGQLGFVFVFLAATVLFTYLCYNYLTVQASIGAAASEITVLENRLAELKADNDVLENRLNASVDLDRVYRVATEELGMVYPYENETITYEAQVREYVRQYDAIPSF